MAAPCTPCSARPWRGGGAHASNPLPPAPARAGVDFFACTRSLANHEFVEGTLPEWLGQVPAAIPAIREWTKDGATYIKS